MTAAAVLCGAAAAASNPTSGQELGLVQAESTVGKQSDSTALWLLAQDTTQLASQPSRNSRGRARCCQTAGLSHYERERKPKLWLWLWLWLFSLFHSATQQLPRQFEKNDTHDR